MEDDPNWGDLDFRRKAAADRLIDSAAVLKAARASGIDIAGAWREDRQSRIRPMGGPASRGRKRDGPRPK